MGIFPVLCLTLSVAVVHATTSSAWDEFFLGCEAIVTAFSFQGQGEYFDKGLAVVLDNVSGFVAEI